MKKFKRLIALVTVAMFILSLAAPVMAADATAAEQEAFARLNALGIAYGNTSGDPMYEKTYTRAEAAAILVQASGMGAAINSAKGATKFKDVPASHWASGVINIASGAGIIYGYNDNTFRPDKEVTYAEMSAMLVQLLNYGTKLQGVWPTNVIGKAAQLGILDGITVTDYNAAAVRGQVFIATDNAMDVVPLEETRDGWVERADGKTLMEVRLNVTKKPEGTVTLTPNYGEKNKVSIDPTPNDTSNNDAYTVTTLDSVNGNSYYGEKVVPWVKDDKVFFFERKNSSDVIIDKLIASKTDNTKIYFDAKDREYLLDDNVKLRANFGSLVEGVNAKNAINGIPSDIENVKVVLTSDGKVGYVEYFTFAQALVKDVVASDEKINAKVGTSIELKNKTYTLTKNGKGISVADVKADDVLDVATNSANDKYYVYVTDKTVTGKVESITSDNKVTIAGTQYKTINVQVSTNDGDTYSASLSDVQGKNVTARLNKDGKIAFIVADSAAESNYFPVIIKSRDKDGSLDKDVWVKVAKADGTNVNYKVTKDTKINGVKVDNTVATGLQNASSIITNGTDTIANGDVVRIELTSAGNEVKEFKTYTLNTDMFVLTSPVVISKTNDTLGGYKANTDSKFVYLNDEGDYKTISWAGVESLESSNQVTKDMTLIVDKGIIKYGFITTVTVSASDFMFGYVKDAGTYDATLDSDWTDVYVNGEIKRYKGNQAANKKQVIQFKISDDEIGTVTTPSAAYAYAGDNTNNTFYLRDYNETDKLLSISVAASGAAKWITFDKDMKVYYDGSLKSLSYAKDKKVQLYDVWNDKGEAGTDGAYDFMVVVD